MRVRGKMVLQTVICSAIFGMGLISASAQSAPAKPDSRTAALPTVDEILAKYVSALGGRTAILKITSRVAKGAVQLDLGGGGATTEIFQKAPNKIFTDTQLPSLGDYRRGYDGAKGWQDTPQTGLDDVTGAQLADLRRGADFYGDIHLKELYPKMTLKGKESFEGRDAYVIVAESKDGRLETWYFDADSGLKIRSLSQAQGPTGTVQVDTRMGDYREVDGVKFPFTLHQSFGPFAFTIKFTEVKQNVPIDDARFTKPSAQ